MVGQVGLEPTMVKPADLQSAAIAARRLTHMVEPAGIEPATLKFQSGAQPSAKSRSRLLRACSLRLVYQLSYGSRWGR